MDTLYLEPNWLEDEPERLVQRIKTDRTPKKFGFYERGLETEVKVDDDREIIKIAGKEYKLVFEVVATSEKMAQIKYLDFRGGVN